MGTIVEFTDRNGNISTRWYGKRGFAQKGGPQPKAGEMWEVIDSREVARDGDLGRPRQLARFDLVGYTLAIGRKYEPDVPHRIAIAQGYEGSPEHNREVLKYFGIPYTVAGQGLLVQFEAMEKSRDLHGELRPYEKQGHVLSYGEHTFTYWPYTHLLGQEQSEVTLAEGVTIHKGEQVVKRGETRRRGYPPFRQTVTCIRTLIPANNGGVKSVMLSLQGFRNVSDALAENYAPYIPPSMPYPWLVEAEEDKRLARIAERSAG